jgi:hypothetical protein
VLCAGELVCRCPPACAGHQAACVLTLKTLNSKCICFTGLCLHFKLQVAAALRLENYSLSINKWHFTRCCWWPVSHACKACKLLSENACSSAGYSHNKYELQSVMRDFPSRQYPWQSPVLPGETSHRCLATPHSCQDRTQAARSSHSGYSVEAQNSVAIKDPVTRRQYAAENENVKERRPWRSPTRN